MISGITGVLLFIIMCIIFIFAHPVIRKRAYPWFWRAHSLHVALYALCLVHGLAKLTGAPRFWIFFMGPAIIYTLDKVSLTIYFNLKDFIVSHCMRVRLFHCDRWGLIPEFVKVLWLLSLISKHFSSVCFWWRCVNDTVIQLNM